MQTARIEEQDVDAVEIEHMVDTDKRTRLDDLLSALDASERGSFQHLIHHIKTVGTLPLLQMMPLKRALTARLALSEAFELLRELWQLPASATLDRRAVRSLHKVCAQRAATYRETAPGGVAFTAHPPKLVGKGDPRPLECTTRTSFVACLAEARVFGRSPFIEFDGDLLMDVEEREFDLVDEQLTVDALVLLQTGKKEVYRCVHGAEPQEIEDAFSLLAPMPGFGHWTSDYLPKYMTALMSAPAEMATTSILVDAQIPGTVRQLLDFVRPPGARVIDIAPLRTVRVRKLWCAPSLSYWPLAPVEAGPLWPSYKALPPDRFAASIREMLRRLVPMVSATDGPELVYFARRSERRKLLNEPMVARILEEAGFVRIYPEDYGIIEQITLVRNARCIVASDGSAATLAFFAEPGTKLCILASECMFYHAGYTNALRELGIDVTILTGPPHGSAFVLHKDYAIPEDLLRTFLGEWID